MGKGQLQVVVTSARQEKPVSGAVVRISQNQSAIHTGVTDINGETMIYDLNAPDASVTLDSNHTGEYYARYDVDVEAEGFPVKQYKNIMVFDTKIMELIVNLTPTPAVNEGSYSTGEQPGADPSPREEDRYIRFETLDNYLDFPPHPLRLTGDRNPELRELPPNTRILPQVVVPHYITVHLDRKEFPASNVTVDFKHYIKNVCTHEIFPTWPQSAIEANIHCQVSLALNRIYTEFYRSQGYPFDITSSTWTDQNFVYQGEIDANISETVDRIFDQYAQRTGHAEPYYTEYCDGVKSTCPGLKQWGTVTLAGQGYTPVQMLRYYYGSDINLIVGEHVEDVEQSFPGTLSQGSSGPAVRALQDYLNRIRVNYPSIPQITDPDGVFGPQTAAAVAKFKTVAGWPMVSGNTGGTVDKATWYNISYAYYAVKKLAQLASEGEVEGVGRIPPTNNTSRQGSKGTYVGRLQYLINVISDFYPEVTPTIQDYNFDLETKESVQEFQKAFGLTADGVVGSGTWAKLYEIYWDIIDQGLLPSQDIPPTGNGMGEYPGSSLGYGSKGETVRALQKCLNNIAIRYPAVGGKLAEDGTYGEATYDAVVAFQNIFGLTADGVVGEVTWYNIKTVCEGSGGGSNIPMPPYPGYALKKGASGNFVKQAQHCLNNISLLRPGIPSIAEDGVFGDVTTSAVRAFQTIFGLTIDGVIGPQTWQGIMDACRQSTFENAPVYPGYNISMGSSGGYVTQIQKCLTNINKTYPTVPAVTADGKFGNLTRVSVTAFQRQFGLTADGIVGKNTWARLFQECASVSGAGIVGGTSGGMSSGISTTGGMAGGATSGGLASSISTTVGSTVGSGTSGSGTGGAVPGNSGTGRPRASTGVGNMGTIRRGGCAAPTDEDELREIAERANTGMNGGANTGTHSGGAGSGGASGTTHVQRELASSVSTNVPFRPVKPQTPVGQTPTQPIPCTPIGQVPTPTPYPPATTPARPTIPRPAVPATPPAHTTPGTQPPAQQGGCQCSDNMFKLLLMMMIMNNMRCNNENEI